jgi:hypothetical protein
MKTYSNIDESHCILPKVPTFCDLSNWLNVKAKKTKMHNVKLQHKWRHNKQRLRDFSRYKSCVVKGAMITVLPDLVLGTFFFFN